LLVCLGGKTYHVVIRMSLGNGCQPQLLALHVMTGASADEVTQQLARLDEGGPTATLLIVDEPVASALRRGAKPRAALAITEAAVRHFLATTSVTRFHVIPKGARYDRESLASAPRPDGELVALCSPRVELPPVANAMTEPQALAWHCSRGVLDALLAAARPADWNAAMLVRALESSRRRVSWCSVRLADDAAADDEVLHEPPISRASRVLAIIPYHEHDDWLFTALTTITGQTRAPDAIVVVDDASPASPRDVVALFPQVTLLRAQSHAGQFALIQQIISTTDFDAYLHQDADDFSAADRLERLLIHGERTGASLVGTQAIQLHWDSGACSLFCFPQRVARPMRLGDYSLLHPTSIVAKRLVDAVGGFSAGLPFGGDTEFQHRARFARATMHNIPFASYFKIVHPRALTIAPETGFHSPARHAFEQVLGSRFAAMFDAVAAGAAPNLTPLRRATPIPLQRVCGPSLGPYWSPTTCK
jgi:hypothetical protein